MNPNNLLEICASIMRSLYTCIYYLFIPYLFIRLWYKSIAMPDYRNRIGERFGLIKVGAMTHIDIWIHTVSLGEVIAATILIEKLLEQNYVLLITTMTPTGAQRVQQIFSNRLLHHYIPYEFPFALRRFFKIFAPKVGIIFETELWPNLITYAKKSNIKLLLFNARMSEKSYHKYSKIRWLIKSLLNKFNGIYTQTDSDSKRFADLSGAAANIQTFGNIKFDLQLPKLIEPEFKIIKNNLGNFRKILIAASTHDNEEQQLLDAFPQLQTAIPGIALLIAPRHPERFTKIYQLSISLGFKTGLRSQSVELTQHTEVVILDSIGELLGFYSISDYAFVGGSLIPHGGHNVLEPIAMQIPVITGTYMHNFQDIYRQLIANNAIIAVKCMAELIAELSALQQHPNKILELIANASQVFKTNQGALSRYLNKINSSV